MPEPGYRVNPFRINRYQRRMLGLPIASLLFLNIVVSVTTMFAWTRLTKMIGPYSPEIDFINSLFIVFLFLIWLYVILVILWMIPVSADLLGAFERLSRNIQEMIRVGRKRKISVRQEDSPAGELVTRINELIQHADFKEE